MTARAERALRSAIADRYRIERELGTAWDVDRASGRMVLTQAIGSADVRIVVMANWLDHFRRGAGAKR